MMICLCGEYIDDTSYSTMCSHCLGRLIDDEDREVDAEYDVFLSLVESAEDMAEELDFTGVVDCSQ